MKSLSEVAAIALELSVSIAKTQGLTLELFLPMVRLAWGNGDDTEANPVDAFAAKFPGGVAPDTERNWDSVLPPEDEHAGERRVRSIPLSREGEAAVDAAVAEYEAEHTAIQSFEVEPPKPKRPRRCRSERFANRVGDTGRCVREFLHGGVHSDGKGVVWTDSVDDH